MVKLDIIVEEDAWKRHTNFSRKYLTNIANITQSALSTTQRINASMCVLLTHSEKMCHLNKEFLGKSYPTNVLAFPYGDIQHTSHRLQLLGDIALGYQIIYKEASEYSIPFVNHASHLLVHGLLHIMGYDHFNKTDAEKMFAKEDKIMQKLKIKQYQKNQFT
ncbi:rRNA maturation RNase YbeY [Candidatus Sneabacter namystus]|uniref:Endoribonuclease YbeY n=1 Tax=Candidatus Sneabacter namystus TaxID=2601646 RepID=A0A5C0UIW6_9RICK|nr:rRNA maturation RNase YbeY [Candidatus Sneabacter namystus]QEK39453.1 rRNA maturation RNase YbeY [Candidatus Sneabacter namystus]